MMHLVYCDNKENVLEQILTGEKTMVIRGAAARKIPHSRVFPEETIYFMEKGSKEISAKGIVREVKNYVKLAEDEITEVIENHQTQLNLSTKQKERWHKKCLCLVAIDQVEAIEPLAFDHQNNMDDWLIIEKIEDVVVGSSIPYDYKKSKF